MAGRVGEPDDGGRGFSGRHQVGPLGYDRLGVEDLVGLGLGEDRARSNQHQEGTLQGTMDHGETRGKRRISVILGVQEPNRQPEMDLSIAPHEA